MEHLGVGGWVPGLVWLSTAMHLCARFCITMMSHDLYAAPCQCPEATVTNAVEQASTTEVHSLPVWRLDV